MYEDQLETRSDHRLGEHPHPPVPEVEEISRFLREKGTHGPDGESVQESKGPGFTVSTNQTVSTSEQVTVSPQAQSKPAGFLARLLRSLGVKVPHITFRVSHERAPFRLEGVQSGSRLTPEEIVELAGGPLPPEERSQCPKCQAVVSRNATKCPWCGTSLQSNAPSVNKEL